MARGSRVWSPIADADDVNDDEEADEAEEEGEGGGRGTCTASSAPIAKAVLSTSTAFAGPAEKAVMFAIGGDGSGVVFLT